MPGVNVVLTVTVHPSVGTEPHSIAEVKLVARRLNNTKRENLPMVFIIGLLAGRFFKYISSFGAELRHVYGRGLSRAFVDAL